MRPSTRPSTDGLAEGLTQESADIIARMAPKHLALEGPGELHDVRAVRQDDESLPALVGALEAHVDERPGRPGLVLELDRVDRLPLSSSGAFPAHGDKEVPVSGYGWSWPGVKCVVPQDALEMYSRCTFGLVTCRATGDS
jgi:hypothetical protein